MQHRKGPNAKCGADGAHGHVLELGLEEGRDKDPGPGPKAEQRLNMNIKSAIKLLQITDGAGRHYVTYIGSPNGPIQRTNPVRYVQYECYETTAGPVRAVRDAKPQDAPPRLDQQMFLWASYVVGQDRNEVWWPTNLINGYKRGPECRINSTCT
jgi:hypothetical protein